MDGHPFAVHLKSWASNPQPGLLLADTLSRWAVAATGPLTADRYPVTADRCTSSRPSEDCWRDVRDLEFRFAATSYVPLLPADTTAPVALGPRKSWVEDLGSIAWIYKFRQSITARPTRDSLTYVVWVRTIPGEPLIPETPVDTVIDVIPVVDGAGGFQFSELVSNCSSPARRQTGPCANEQVRPGYDVTILGYVPLRSVIGASPGG